MRLLLAEDDVDIQRVARLALRADFEVTIANDGVEALAQAVTTKPEVILLDLMMPKMDGFETCRRLKADAITRDIPIIFLTARSQESEINEGLALGAVGYLTKPFDARTLGSRIRALLQR